MPFRSLGPLRVSAIGLGCMNLSHAYGAPMAEADASRLVNQALDHGVTLLDTAALYGFGRNETLLGRAVMHRRQDFVLASKCGMTGVDGKRVIDGRPATLMKTIDEALLRLDTDVIDLYYLHRWDRTVPIEESVGALARMVESGKIRAIGLSEVSAATLRRAHAVHPIAAVQSEYSLCTRNAEIAVLDACRTLGIGFVAFSPLSRGLLADAIDGPNFASGDIRLSMPRFQADVLAANQPLLAEFRAIASAIGTSCARLALAWLLHKDPCVVPIPGTTRAAHLFDNLGATAVVIDTTVVSRLDRLFSPDAIVGDRYAPATAQEVDMETFDRSVFPGQAGNQGRKPLSV